MEEEAGSWKPHSGEGSACLGLEEKVAVGSCFGLFLCICFQNAKGEPWKLGEE